MAVYVASVDHALLSPGLLDAACTATMLCKTKAMIEQNSHEWRQDKRNIHKLKHVFGELALSHSRQTP
jgi:hypothetical protein